MKTSLSSIQSNKNVMNDQLTLKNVRKILDIDRKVISKLIFNEIYRGNKPRVDCLKDRKFRDIQPVISKKRRKLFATVQEHLSVMVATRRPRRS